MIQSWISWIWTNIILKFGPAFLAVVLTQKFIEVRKPKLEMVLEGVRSNSLKTLTKNTGRSESRYHMWRIQLQHIKIPWYLGWLIRSREAALQCKADLTFYSSKNSPQFSMQGRWANTPEISHLAIFDQMGKVLYPDTVNVAHNLPELLDCVVKFDNDKDNMAYSWNTEAYFTNGRNPN